MTIAIYDYSNQKKEVVLPDKEIARICVVIFSGDETVDVEFTDGESIHLDASDTRFASYYDGEYAVKGDSIEKWLNFVPSGETSASYERQECFMYE